MAGTNGSLQPNPIFESLFAALDPVALIKNSNSDKINTLKQLATTESFIMERGPRYRAYAELRETRLRMKHARKFEEPESRILTPTPKKQVKFQGNFPAVRKVSSSSSSSSVLAQSVPDFSSVLRKENRKPPATRLPPMLEMTPPPKGSARFNGIMSRLGGSQSANAGEKKGGGLMARKSCASFEELKGFSSAAANAIAGGGENRGGRSGRGIGTKTVLGYRQY